MSEMEQLKKNADEAKMRQTVQSVSDYLDRLSAEIYECNRRKNDSGIIYMVAWLSWIASLLIPEGPMSNPEYLFIMIFMFALMYDNFRHTKLVRALAEFRGVVETLRLLGMIPPNSEKGTKRRKRVWGEGIDLVKSWFAKKKAAQDKVYAPA